MGYRYSGGSARGCSEVRGPVRPSVVYKEYLAGGKSQLAITRGLAQATGSPTKARRALAPGHPARDVGEPDLQGLRRPQGRGLIRGTTSRSSTRRLWDKVAALRDAPRGAPGAALAGGRGGQSPIPEGQPQECGRCGGSLVPRTEPNRTRAIPSEVYRCYRTPPRSGVLLDASD